MAVLLLNISTKADQPRLLKKTMADKIAVIMTGGKQYKVKEGEIIKVEKLDSEDASTVKFETLLTGTEDGAALEVGKPSLGEKVEGKVLAQERADKVTVFKYKNKTRYKRTVGHRQNYTKVQITKIA